MNQGSQRLDWVRLGWWAAILAACLGIWGTVAWAVGRYVGWWR